MALFEGKLLYTLPRIRRNPFRQPVIVQQAEAHSMMHRDLPLALQRTLPVQLGYYSLDQHVTQCDRGVLEEYQHVTQCDRPVLEKH